MANTQDEQNRGKIEAGIDELEKETAVELRRQMGSAKRKMTRSVEDDMANKIYQNKPSRGIPLTPDDKKKNVNAPDKIYRPKRKEEDEDEGEEGEEEEKDEGEEGKEKKRKNKTFRQAQGKEETPKTNEEVKKEDKTPEWQKQEPKTTEGGMARADTGDISPQKKKEEKPTSGEDKQKQQAQNGKELDRKKRREKRAQQKKEKAQKRAAAAQSGTQTSEKAVGKMSPLSFIFWICSAVICDLLSLIPYVGVIASWPFATAFAAYKWIIKIKKEVAIATSALDFILEGLLSTLPVNTIDVIITFIVSRSKTVRTITQKMPSAASKK